MEEATLGPWMLPQNLEELHDAIIEFAIAAQMRADTELEKHPRGSLSSKALERLLRTAIVTHRSVKTLCVSGWTVTTPTILRALVDILVSVVAIGDKELEIEYMGFRFMTHALIEGMHDSNLDPNVRKADATQVDILKSFLSPSDRKRADDLIADYAKRTRHFWYAPEIPNPGTAINQKMPQLKPIWKTFSSSTHGADIGSVLFADNPDYAGINPEENPKKTRIAIVISSRFLLDIAHARATIEGVADDTEYVRIIRTLIQPQEAKINAAT